VIALTWAPEREGGGGGGRAAAANGRKKKKTEVSGNLMSDDESIRFIDLDRGP